MLPKIKHIARTLAAIPFTKCQFHFPKSRRLNLRPSVLNIDKNHSYLAKAITHISQIDRSFYVQKILQMLQPNQQIVFLNSSYFNNPISLLLFRYFLQPKVDKKTGAFTMGKMEYEELFCGGNLKVADINASLKKLPISCNQMLMRTYAGKFPVIYFGFKLVGTSKQQILSSVNKAISYIFQEHRYILDSLERKQKMILLQPKLQQQQHKSIKLSLQNKIEYYRKIIDLTSPANQNVQMAPVGCIQFLLQLLTEYYGRQTVILIDGYDRLIFQLRLTPFFLQIAVGLQLMIRKCFEGSKPPRYCLISQAQSAIPVSFKVNIFIRVFQKGVLRFNGIIHMPFFEMTKFTYLETSFTEIFFRKFNKEKMDLFYIQHMKRIIIKYYPKRAIKATFKLYLYGFWKKILTKITGIIVKIRIR